MPGRRMIWIKSSEHVGNSLQRLRRVEARRTWGGPTLEDLSDKANTGGIEATPECALKVVQRYGRIRFEMEITDFKRGVCQSVLQSRPIKRQRIGVIDLIRGIRSFARSGLQKRDRQPEVPVPKGLEGFLVAHRGILEQGQECETGTT